MSATTRRSHAARDRLRSSTCPGCRRSKQPFVSPTFSPLAFQSATMAAAAALPTIFGSSPRLDAPQSGREFLRMHYRRAALADGDSRPRRCRSERQSSLRRRKPAPMRARRQPCRPRRKHQRPAMRPPGHASRAPRPRLDRRSSCHLLPGSKRPLRLWPAREKSSQRLLRDHRSRNQFRPSSRPRRRWASEPWRPRSVKRRAISDRQRQECAAPSRLRRPARMSAGTRTPLA